jgi:putative ABC transport system permease protein
MNDTFDGTFSLLQMLWGNIVARPLRSFLTVIAIAIQVILVLLIVGFTSGVISEWGKRVEGVGADLLVQPPNSSIFFAFSSAVMQESLANKIAALPGVDEVAPTLILTEPKNLGLVYGIDYKRFNALSRGFLFRDGRPFESPDEAIADDIIAQTKHLKVGQQITLLNHPFTVCGIVAHGKGARYFIPLKTAQEIAGAENRVSMFYVRSKGDTEGTREQIINLASPDHLSSTSEFVVRSTSEYVTLMSSSNLPQLRPFTRSMVGLGIVISFLVVLLNVHTMVMERTREIGILKALGLTKLGIIRMLLGETMILTCFGCILGIVLTFIFQAILKETNPGLMILITPQWVFSAALLALAGAAIGAMYPALRAASYDPVVALAYE